MYFSSAFFRVDASALRFPINMFGIIFRYMSSKLFKVASEHSSVVAVVGRGHLAGIKKHWKQPLQVNWHFFSFQFTNKFSG